MANEYKISANTKIGHVQLKVANLNRALEFHCGIPGFELTTMYGDDDAFIPAVGYPHHIGLNTWYSKGSEPAPKKIPGLFHTAILYPPQKDLAEIFVKVQKAGYGFTGASDHGVSEALYLDDPDGNGVELYWDRPKDKWLKNGDGNLMMFPKPLDLEGLKNELN